MSGNLPAGVRDADFGMPDDDVCAACASHIDDCECDAPCGSCNGCRKRRGCELLDPYCP